MKGRMPKGPTRGEGPPAEDLKDDGGFEADRGEQDAPRPLNIKEEKIYE
jgi:hypothetical protein